MIKLYTLSTCPWCKRLKGFLQQEGIEYSFVDVDLLHGAERDLVLAEIDRISDERAFPLTVINGRTVKGYNTGQLMAVLHDEE